MGEKMSRQSRREFLERLADRYRVASWKEKGRILDEFVSGSGYHRKHAIALLNGPRPSATPRSAPPAPPPRRYDGAVRLALIQVWKAANRICAKRLIPFLPEFVSALERFGHLSLPGEVREKLLAMSCTTADRLLYDERHPEGRSISTTRPGTLLKQKITVRTFSDWNDVAPGFMEADLVAHCGDRADGTYLNTLVLTDVATGWTECMALLRRSEADVSGAIHALRKCLPFPLLGLDTDNGGEFINYELLRYCEREKITFTRSRAYRKNDQAFVEEKNGSVVRRLVGYDRYEGTHAWKALGSLYAVLRLYVNFFQPSMKLLSKVRVQARTTKRYDRAQTPYQRALNSSAVGEEQKQRLRDSYQTLDPLGLLNELERLQDRFWEHAHQKANAGGQLLESIKAGAEGWTSPRVEPIRVDATSQAPAAPATQAAAITGPPRMYRRTRKPSGPRTWRTRKDPFADVWGLVQLQLDIDPSRTVKDLFLELQQRYPGQFADGQLRTLQRRAQQRRREQIYLAATI